MNLSQGASDSEQQELTIWEPGKLVSTFGAIRVEKAFFVNDFLIIYMKFSWGLWWFHPLHHVVILRCFMGTAVMQMADDSVNVGGRRSGYKRCVT